jgi:hypothetical protein
VGNPTLLGPLAEPALNHAKGPSGVGFLTCPNQEPYAYLNLHC